MKKLNQQGVAATFIILILILLLAIGGVGYYVWKQRNEAKSAGDTTPSQPRTSEKKEEEKPAPDPYAGWKTYCGYNTNGCFRYPSEWRDVVPTNSGLAISQNKGETLTLEYTEPASGKEGLGVFYTSSTGQLAKENNSYKVVGGYYTVSNVPGYNLVDASLVSQFGLAAGKTSTVAHDSDLYFTANSKKATLVVHLNNTTGGTKVPVSQANDWFNSSDGKLALQIVQSYYTK